MSNSLVMGWSLQQWLKALDYYTLHNRATAPPVNIVREFYGANHQATPALLEIQDFWHAQRHDEPLEVAL